jgi:hypothetical protein
MTSANIKISTNERRHITMGSVQGLERWHTLWGAAERHRRGRFEVAPTTAVDASMQQDADLQRPGTDMGGWGSAAAIGIGQGSSRAARICSDAVGDFVVATLIWEGAG